MKRNICLCLFSGLILSFFLSLNLIGKESCSSSSLKFLGMVRRNHPVDTWGMMSGEVSHRRKGESTKTTLIKLGIRFTDTMVFAKIVIGKGNREESYVVGQPYNGDVPSIITSADSQDLSELANYGLKPEDITMAFLYWKFEKELEKTTLKGMDCRVLLLSNPETKEQVKAYVTSDYYYPMKAEWIKPEEEKAYRTYYINSFTKDNNLWAPSSFYLCGPGWRTNVEFDKVNLGFVKNGLPKDLF